MSGLRKNDQQIEAPPLCWRIVTIVVGLLTGVGLVVGLSCLEQHLQNEASMIERSAINRQQT